MAARVGNNYRAQGIGKTALQRFAEKCVFDYSTGCVLWAGGTTAGQGNTTRYGVFWDGKQRVFAHRWSAVHIHGIDLGSNEAGHCCPCGPNSLCVQHLAGQTKAENVAERNVRVAKANQSASTRQAWLFVQLGIHESAPEPPAISGDISFPYHQPPEWLRPYIKPPEATDDDDCPF